MNNKWWHERIFYQIYPRSFYDTNKDGVGDIPGIIAKLPYLKSLNVGAIWISPLYKSPNFDNGYDISDYKSIHPEYGTMEDMDKLLAEAKKLDIKIIMDLVINHTSFQHDWFLKSKDPNSEYHNYYFWRKGKVTKKGKKLPPNNWQSMFTGPAWTYEPSNDMWYLHLFTSEQPDLNYDNPKVLEEVKSILRFWLDKGVAGFRCDVINLISKTSLKDGKPKVYKTGKEHYLNAPGCHLILKQLNDEIFEPYGAYTVGETMDITIDAAKAYLDGELTQVFAFDQVQVDYFLLPLFKRKYKPHRMVKALKKWQLKIPWNTVFYENHDLPRSVSRFGSNKYYNESVSALHASILFLKGTPYIYQGQEIGMTNVDFGSIEKVEDVSSRNVYNLLRKFKVPPKLAWRLVNNFTRDHGRSPVQWNSKKHGGFTDGKPWLMVNPNYPEINVEAREKDNDSVLHHYRKMATLRQKTKAFRNGDLAFVKTHRDILAFTRTDHKDEYLVVINLASKKRPHRLDLDGEILYSNYKEFEDNARKLRPFEVQIIKRID
ncbi:MAG: Oligo-1,6-glucosidase [Tenericutes bacterium ADurb.Bin239]|nr:MAG: Oligo-1,6-glucosidase [Tenericutes bacterium ADurb.Bin239]